jgi:hypothetical protein
MRRRLLAAMLARDEIHRQRVAVTLPGQPPAAPAPVPASNGHGERRTLRDHDGGRAIGGDTPTDADAEGPYTRAELLQMDQRFTAALERAIASGKEHRPAPPR